MRAPAARHRALRGHWDRTDKNKGWLRRSEPPPEAGAADSCENPKLVMISLAQTAILLAAAVVAVSLFRFARLSSILGYLAAGLVIGPWGLNLIGDIDRIMQVSEFGIVLLLFIIGLELQPTRLWVMRRVVFGLGAAQVALCAVLLGAGAWALGEPPVAAAVIGFGLSLSSTPLVLPALPQRRHPNTQYLPAPSRFLP